MSRRARKPPPGIELRHSERCRSLKGGTCDCDPKYRAIVSLAGGRKMQRQFLTLAAAKQWRNDVQVDLRRGALTIGVNQTIRDAASEWLAGARSGAVRNRSGEVYKPSAIRGYDQALRDYIVPALGGAGVAELKRPDVQRLVDDLVGAGLSASTVRNALMPLRAMCRRALLRGDLSANPTLGLELPAQRGRRDRVASPQEAAMLLSALPATDRAIWATALYAGLRLGELQALRWEDIDLDGGLIHVRRSWDRHEGVVEPKSRAGTRVVPVVAALRHELRAHRQRQPIFDLALGRADDRPFSASGVVDRAYRVWRQAGLKAISPHECRHTFATMAIAAGVNIKALQTFMGHASITVTLDRYGHLLPGSEAHAGSLLDAYLSNAPAKGPGR